MPDNIQLTKYIQALDKGDEASRRQAIHALKQLGDEDWAAAPRSSVKSLVESLQEQLRGGIKQPSVRQELATVLGNLGAHAEAAVPQLLEMLEPGVPDAICEAAVIALGKIGKDAKSAVDRLIVLLENKRASLAIQAIRALGNIGCADQRVRSALGNLWLSAPQSQKSQVNVAMALCKLKIEAKELVPYLTTMLVMHQDAALRKLAAEALAYCNKTETDVVPALLAAAMHDKDENVRQLAAASLERLSVSHDKAIQLCTKQLATGSFAEAALRHSGQQAVPALIEALATPDPIIREKAARLLGGFGELAAAAAPALRALLREKDLTVRLAIAKSLWHITKDADAVIPVLANLLEVKWPAAADASEDSRRKFLQPIMDSLRRIGPPAKAAIPALSSKAKDKNRLISESAVTALREIAPAVAVKAGAQ